MFVSYRNGKTNLNRSKENTKEGSNARKEVKLIDLPNMVGCIEVDESRQS